MPKQQQNQPFLRDETSRLFSCRLAFCLAALISLGIGLPATSRAEGGDLNISRDGSNVNVNLNTASSPDVSIRRSDDIMIIKVPKSYKGGISIDPTLRKNSVVQEVETSSGKAITIQSQQIYLHTSEGESGSAPPDAKEKAKKTDGRVEDHGNQEESGPGKPGFLQLSPTESSNGSGTGSGTSNGAHQTEAQSENHGGNQPRTERHRHRRSTATPSSPLDLTRLLEQGSLLSTPVAPKSTYEPGESHNTRPHPQPAQSRKAHGKSRKPKPLAQNDPTTATENGQVTPDDLESEPLEADSKRQAAAIQASINGMLRIFFSLVLVLGMVVAFVKVLLPKLLERYPDFFDRLRESRQWSTEMPSQMRNNWSKPAQKSVPKPEKKAPAYPESPKSNPITALAEQIITPFINPTNSPSPIHPPAQVPTKKSYLERLKVAGDYFQVLQTTILGKGKELHLVELKGKQFLVATTPYTVSLLKDLSEEEPSSNPPNWPLNAPAAPTRPHQPVAKPEAKRIAQQSTASYQPPSYPSPAPQQSRAPRQQKQPEAPTPVRSETIAYLSDETPIYPTPASQTASRPGSSSKPYATPPGASRQVRRKPAIPQFPAVPVDEDYPTYLDAPQRPQSNQRPTPPTYPQAAYIDAEEVVVLEDYDDLYGR